jgi:hypothetical protein
MPKGKFIMLDYDEKLKGEAEFWVNDTKYRLTHEEIYDLPQRVINFIESCQYRTSRYKYPKAVVGETIMSWSQQYAFIEPTEEDKAIEKLDAIKKILEKP